MGFADDVKGKAEELGDKASDALDVAKDKVEEAWDTVSDKAEEAFEAAKDTASGFVGSVKERFESGAEPPTSEEAQPAEPVEDFAAAGTVPEDVVDRTAVIEEASAETARHVQPGQL